MIMTFITQIRTGCFTALLMATFLFTGCEHESESKSNSTGLGGSGGGSASSSSAEYISISGSWTGIYAIYDGATVSDRQSLTANIDQDEDAVVINTSLPSIGRFFTGSINTDGNMRLTDAFDGELWTTYYGPVTRNSIRIADFVRRPTPSDPNPPIAVIELSR